MGDMDMDNKDH